MQALCRYSTGCGVCPLKRDRVEKEAVYGALATDEEANRQILGC